MKRLRRAVRRIREKCREEYLVGKCTMLFNFLMAVVKLTMGIFRLSYFICVHGLYSLAVGGAKAVYLRGSKAAADQSGERKYYLAICGVLALASALYIVYMVRLFFLPSEASYGMYFAIAAAAVSFSELGVAIYGMTRANRQKDLLRSGVKCVSLASAFAALSFTQVALLSFTRAGTDMSHYNAIGGVTMGGLCLLVCLYMFLRYLRETRIAKRAAQKSADPD